MNSLRPYWRFHIAFILSTICVLYLRSNALEAVTQEVIALFGLMMAAVLPTMILTASVLRPGGMSVKKIVEYKHALVSQTKVWAGLFLWSLLCCMLVVIAKIAEWNLPISVKTYSIDFIHIINFGIYFGSFIILFRVFSIVDGIISLIELSAGIAITEAQDQNKAAYKFDLTDVKSSENHGQTVDLFNDNSEQ